MSGKNFCKCCGKPKPRNVSGYPPRRCVFCGQLSVPARHQVSTSAARLGAALASALPTLESLPKEILIKGRNGARTYLTVREQQAIDHALWFAAAAVQRRNRYPDSLRCEGIRLQLKYSSFGRIFIVSELTGKTLAASSFNAL